MLPGPEIAIQAGRNATKKSEAEALLHRTVNDALHLLTLLRLVRFLDKTYTPLLMNAEYIKQPGQKIFLCCFVVFLSCYSRSVDCNAICRGTPSLSLDRLIYGKMPPV